MDVKIPTQVCFTKSNSPGLPDPPILGQTNDRCIKSLPAKRNFPDAEIKTRSEPKKSAPSPIKFDPRSLSVVEMLKLNCLVK